MRTLAVVAPLAAVIAAALPASAQTADRYGGVNYYPAPAMQAPPTAQAPQRVLSWPGKTMPVVAPQPVYGAPYAAPRPPAYAQQPYAAPAYPPQAYAPPPYPAAPQPPAAPPQPLAYYPVPAAAPPQPAAPRLAPPAAAPSPPQGYAPMGVYMPPPNAARPAEATAPSGVYPAQPGYPQPGYPAPGMPANAYPPAPFAQGPTPQAPFPAAQAAAPQPRAPAAAPPAPPTSIYAPAPQARNTPAPPPAAPAPPQPQMMAMNTAAAPQTARLYSVHRPFGLEPDHPVVSPQFFGDAVDLAEPPPPVERARTIASGAGKGRAVVRSRDDDQDLGPDAN